MIDETIHFFVLITRVISTNIFIQSKRRRGFPTKSLWLRFNSKPSIFIGFPVYWLLITDLIHKINIVLNYISSG